MSDKTEASARAPIIADEAAALAQYCPDLENWPRSWSYEERDIAPGKRIVECLKPFLLHLLSQGFVVKTLRKHRDHVWMLGGEVIRRRQEDATLRRQTVEETLLSLLEEDGGPLIWPRISEQQQDAFDATCRKLYRHITAVENAHE